ncbi:MAG: adenylosuccinate lyase [Candidatus Levybacteria bacterium CG10_big_fil_rev_8_21_14_0_10_36_30]|nr:MAG: adenylosuccinate lyase [Candidatus Levybacteria bacterium CG10_big_fil_rev_8_21_14_0_10_36_30]
MAGPERPALARRSFDRLDPLTAVSPLDGRYAEESKPIRQYSSELATMSVRVEVEAKYLVALSDYGVIRNMSQKERVFLEKLGPRLTLADGRRIKYIEKSPGGTDHDLKAVELWMKERFKGISLEDLSEMIHFSLTSEDVDNLALRLNIQRLTENIYIPAAEGIVDNLLNKAEQYKELPVEGRTHGQDALPVTYGHEFAVFAERIEDEVEKLENQKLKGKLNGAVGVFSAHTATMPDVDWIDFSEKFVRSLGLDYKLATTQTNPYEDILERIQIVQRINNVVRDMDQDMWRYISDDWLAQEIIKTATGSSTMAQKVNPIQLENSEAHTELSSGNVDIFVRELPISRLQRDLSDSALRRYIMPNVYATSLISYKNALTGLKKVYPDTDVIGLALDSNWAVMSEFAQQTLRRAGYDNAYMTLKDRVRGVKVDTKEKWEQIVRSLPGVTDELITKILSQTPRTYLGKSAEITDITIAKCKVKILA